MPLSRNIRRRDRRFNVFNPVRKKINWKNQICALWWFQKYSKKIKYFNWKIEAVKIFLTGNSHSRSSHSSDTDIECNPFKHSWELRVWIRIYFVYFLTCLFRYLLRAIMLLVVDDAVWCYISSSVPRLFEKEIYLFSYFANFLREFIKMSFTRGLKI